MTCRIWSHLRCGGGWTEWTCLSETKPFPLFIHFNWRSSTTHFYQPQRIYDYSVIFFLNAVGRMIYNFCEANCLLDVRSQLNNYAVIPLKSNAIREKRNKEKWSTSWCIFHMRNNGNAINAFKIPPPVCFILRRAYREDNVLALSDRNYLIRGLIKIHIVR